MHQPLLHPAEHVPGFKPIPARAGIGLKPEHYNSVLDSHPNIGWIEVHPENYLVAGGPRHHYLTRIRNDYPLSFHSVGMSLGSADGPNMAHLLRLKALCERYQPALVSDHLSWSRWEHCYLNDLLPLPWSQAALQMMVSNVNRVQEVLGRRIGIENPSTYLALPDGDMAEWEFLVELVRRTGASILLDINNIHVSSSNHGWSSKSYIERIPADLVSEIHLAGHKVEETSSGRLLIDDHGSRVSPDVWALYAHALRLLGPRPTLIEWDTDVPELPVLLLEAATADDYMTDFARREQRHG